MSLDDFDLDPIGATVERTRKQLAAAAANLARPAEAYLRWPWGDLDALYGGMAPGQTHYVCGFSGRGKTTFISSAIRRWVEMGIYVDVLPLETDPETFRTILACQQLGVPPGYVTSGDLTRSLDHKQQEDRINRAMALQLEDSHFNVQALDTLDLKGLERAFKEACKRDSKVIVVDHIDHLGTKDFKESAQINARALALAKEYGLVAVLMSQCNNESMKGSQDKLASYGAPGPNHVAMGSEKRNRCSGMLGIYRPIRPLMPDEDPKDHAKLMHAARTGEADPQTVLHTGRTGIVLMKSRSYGEDDGRRITLAYRNGSIDDLDDAQKLEDASRTHGISTHRRPI